MTPLVCSIHYVGGFIIMVLVGWIFESSFSAQTPQWQMAAVTFGAFPASLFSLLWIVIGYPLSLAKIVIGRPLRRRRIENERLEEAKAAEKARIESQKTELIAMIDEALEENTSGGDK